jgi:hypothetical protein
MRLKQLIFRYDNAPHHPEIVTYPHHKHTPTAIELASPPHLVQVLQEIGQQPDWLLIYRIENDELQLARTGSHAELFR